LFLFTVLIIIVIIFTFFTIVFVIVVLQLLIFVLILFARLLTYREISETHGRGRLQLVFVSGLLGWTLRWFHGGLVFRRLSWFGCW
jgi:hypothetical protein